MQIEISMKFLAIYTMLFTVAIPTAMLLIGFLMGRATIKPTVVDVRGEIVSDEKPVESSGLLELDPVEKAMRGE